MDNKENYTVKVLRTFAVSPFRIDVIWDDIEDCCFVVICYESEADGSQDIITLCSHHALNLAKILKKAARFAVRIEA